MAPWRLLEVWSFVYSIQPLDALTKACAMSIYLYGAYNKRRRVTIVTLPDASSKNSSIYTATFTLRYETLAAVLWLRVVYLEQIQFKHASPTNTDSSVFIRILKLITDEKLKNTDD